MRTVIYGSQGVALGTCNAIRKIFPSFEITCYLVTKRDMNPTSLCGVPVMELEEFASEYDSEDKNNVQILIATPESVMSEIEQNLDNAGFYNHVRLDSLRWAQMQRNSFIRDMQFTPLEVYPVGFHKADLYVYKAKFYKDKSLQTDWKEPNYIIPLQVGASQTDIRVADVLDCTGDHISDKNGNYSELTGLYWIWKNRIRNKYYGDGCYFGLAHYRRFLDLSQDDLLRLQDNSIDVILPYPMPYDPDIEEHHKRYLSDAEWNNVLQALKELQPEFYMNAKDILKQEYFYNYNIIIAKDCVLDDYCGWLFPILFRIEELNNNDEIKEPNRYIGYVGETLETLYFMYNKRNLSIAYAGCRFLV